MKDQSVATERKRSGIRLVSDPQPYQGPPGLIATQQAVAKLNRTLTGIGGFGRLSAAERIAQNARALMPAIDPPVAPSIVDVWRDHSRASMWPTLVVPKFMFGTQMAAIFNAQQEISRLLCHDAIGDLWSKVLTRGFAGHGSSAGTPVPNSNWALYRPEFRCVLGPEIENPRRSIPGKLHPTPPTECPSPPARSELFVDGAASFFEYAANALVQLPQFQNLSDADARHYVTKLAIENPERLFQLMASAVTPALPAAIETCAIPTVGRDRGGDRCSMPPIAQTVGIGPGTAFAEAREQDNATTVYARVVSSSGSSSTITQAEYRDLVAARCNYDFVVDGVSKTVYRRDENTMHQDRLTTAEFEMVKQYILTRRILRPVQAILGSPDYHESAIKVFERARRKVDKKIRRGEWVLFRAHLKRATSDKAFEFAPGESVLWMMVYSE